jgi:hypothetical protein
MNRNTGFLCVLFLTGLLLNACGPVTVNIPPITPPPIGVTIVLGGDTPTGGPTAGAATPAPGGSGDNTPSNAVMLLFYGVLVLAGVILLVALFSFLRRPDQ